MCLFFLTVKLLKRSETTEILLLLCINIHMMGFTEENCGQIELNRSINKR